MGFSLTNWILDVMFIATILVAAGYVAGAEWRRRNAARNRTYRSRQAVLAFAPCLVSGGGQATIEVEVLDDRVFFPERMVVPEAIAQYFIIESIIIRQTEHLLGSIPATIFHPTLSPALTIGPMTRGAPMVMRIRNRSPEPQRFMGGLVGRSEPSSSGAVCSSGAAGVRRMR